MRFSDQERSRLNTPLLTAIHTVLNNEDYRQKVKTTALWGVAQGALYMPAQAALNVVFGSTSNPKAIINTLWQEGKVRVQSSALPTPLRSIHSITPFYTGLGATLGKLELRNGYRSLIMATAKEQNYGPYPQALAIACVDTVQTPLEHLAQRKGPEKIKYSATGLIKTHGIVPTTQYLFRGIGGVYGKYGAYWGAWGVVNSHFSTFFPNVDPGSKEAFLMKTGALTLFDISPFTNFFDAVRAKQQLVPFGQPAPSFWQAAKETARPETFVKLYGNGFPFVVTIKAVASAMAVYLYSVNNRPSHTQQVLAKNNENTRSR